MPPSSSRALQSQDQSFRNSSGSFTSFSCRVKLNDSLCRLSLFSPFQARMDDIVTLWEYVSADSDISGSSSTTSNSSFYLDVRSQLSLPPSLLTDPIPQGSHQRTLSSSTAASSAYGSLAHQFPSSPQSAKSGSNSGGSGNGSGTSSSPSASGGSGSGSSDEGALGKVKGLLKGRVHVPLEVGKREIEEAGKWIVVVKTVVGELEERLKG